MTNILLLNGPNLNLLGTREPHHYGAATLQHIVEELRGQAAAAGFRLLDFQSNAEHELIDRVQQAPQRDIAFIILNPAALTHTSIGLRDALQAVAVPFVEIHLSNIYAREAFRRKSYFSDIATGVISGFGATGYRLALQAAVQYLTVNQ